MAEAIIHGFAFPSFKSELLHTESLEYTWWYMNWHFIHQRQNTFIHFLLNKANWYKTKALHSMMTWQLPSSTSHESLKARLWRSFDQYCTTVDAFLICYEVMHSNTVLVGNVDCHNVSTHKNVSHYLVLHFHLSLNHKGRQGTTDDFKNSFLYFFPVLHCPLGLCKLQACPFPDAVFLPLPLSALSSSPFHCALQDGSG